jgi:hypothetical protein
MNSLYICSVPSNENQILCLWLRVPICTTSSAFCMVQTNADKANCDANVSIVRRSKLSICFRGSATLGFRAHLLLLQVLQRFIWYILLFPLLSCVQRPVLERSEQSWLQKRLLLHEPLLLCRRVNIHYTRIVLFSKTNKDLHDV